MKHILDDDIFVFLMTLFAFLLVMGILVLVFDFAAKTMCNNKWYEFEHSYHWSTDCMLKINNKWIPATSYREYR